jgi:molecular chaperone DnaK (HSP70)
LTEKVFDTVVTVPVYFNDGQLTKDTDAIEELNILLIINSQ